MTTGHIGRLQAAVIDGRARNIYFRQAQLERLCNGLLAQEATLRDTMISDSNYTPSEAIAVLHASVQALKDAYASLQPTQALENEYGVSHGRDTPDNRIPVGLVYIEPEPHTLLYSICSALSAAIAAGNCVVLLLENTLREMPFVVREILVNALDADTFAIITTPLKDQDIPDNAIVIQRQINSLRPRANELLSPTDSVAVAVVDRTADIGLAARELVQARTAFGARSPYAPEIVMVNEFVIQTFLDAVVAASGKDVLNTSNERLCGNGRAERLLKVDLVTSTIVSGETGLNLEQILQTKANEPFLVIRPVRSLDDAINVLDEHHTCAYLAAYHFCDLRSAKYLSQFVNADVTFVNQISRELLIGPAASKSHNFDLRHRYPTSVFSRTKPVFVEYTQESQRLAKVFSSRDNATSQSLLEEAKQPLKVMKRSKGGGVGFFEQGFLLNASFILVSIVSLSTTAAWQLWKYRSSK